MTFGLLLSLIGIALLDSLNPSLFIAQFYLLTTPRPVPRILSYIAGVLIVMVVGGVLILGGFRAIITELLATIPAHALYGLQFVLGLAFLIFGLWYRANQGQSTTAVQKPRSLRLMHTFVLGMIVMLNEITTALPYFVALDRIAAAQLSIAESLVALLIYNAVFSLPLFGFLLAFLAARQRFTAQIERISQFIARWTPRVIKYASIGFGGLLAANGALLLASGVGLFG